MELLAVVDVDDLAQPGDRPARWQAARGKPVALVRHRVGDAGGDTGGRGRVEGQVEAAVHAGAKIDGQRDEGASDHLQGFRLDRHDVAGRVVDLDDLQGALGLQGAPNGIEFIPRSLGPLSALCPLPFADRRQPEFNRLARRLLQPLQLAPGMDALHESRFPWLDELQVTGLDFLFDNRLHPLSETARSRPAAGRPRQQRLGARIGLIGTHEPVKMLVRNAESFSRRRELLDPAHRRPAVPEPAVE